MNISDVWAKNQSVRQKLMAGNVNGYGEIKMLSMAIFLGNKGRWKKGR